LSYTRNIGNNWVSFYFMTFSNILFLFDSVLCCFFRIKMLNDRILKDLLGEALNGKVPISTIPNEDISNNKGKKIYVWLTRLVKVHPMKK
jgi:hypothetical protein